ncbi:MAG: lipopolysaccharide biosynthesis, partial [Nostoc sp.]
PPISYIGSAALTYSGPPVSFSTTGSQIQQQGKELNEDVLLSNQIIVGVAEKAGVKPKKLADSIALTLPKKNARTGELESSILDLKYVDTDAKRAIQVLGELMQSMIKLSSDINTKRLQDIIQKINDRTPQAKRELQIAENKLEQYDRIERTAILAAENGSLLSAITASQNLQRQIQLTISGVDGQVRSLQNKLGLTVGQAYISSALSADPIIASLRSQIY